MYAIFEHYSPELRRAAFDYFNSLPVEPTAPHFRLRKRAGRDDGRRVCPVGACELMLDPDAWGLAVDLLMWHYDADVRAAAGRFIYDYDGGRVADLATAMGIEQGAK